MSGEKTASGPLKPVGLLDSSKARQKGTHQESEAFHHNYIPSGHLGVNEWFYFQEDLSNNNKMMCTTKHHHPCHTGHTLKNLERPLVCSTTYHNTSKQEQTTDQHINASAKCVFLTVSVHIMNTHTTALQGHALL